MPELRKDPVIDRWVIIATERGARPSELVQTPGPSRGGFCPLCEGNENKTPSEVFAIRKGNTLRNTPGWQLRVVPNKFPALRLEGVLRREDEGLYERITGIGTHEVVVETPCHDATLSDLSEDAVKNVLVAYRERIVDLGRDPRLRYIMVFKNHGATPVPPSSIPTRRSSLSRSSQNGSKRRWTGQNSIMTTRGIVFSVTSSDRSTPEESGSSSRMRTCLR